MSLKTTLKENTGRATRTYKTSENGLAGSQGFRWWEEKNADTRAKQLIATVDYVKSAQLFRQRQAAQFARLYGGRSLHSFFGSGMSTLDQNLNLAPNRPTYNLISSVTDTLVSRLSQSRPVPVFLTDNGDYKERNLAKKLNNFILGEFYTTKAYEIGEFILTDALVQGTGCLKVLEGMDNRVAIERVPLTEIFVDLQEAEHGDPRRLYQVKLMDRAMLESMFPKNKEKAAESPKAYLDSSGASSQSVADLVMVVEGWALPSSKDAGDGYHVIACGEGNLFSEPWTKQKFPFVFLNHKKRQLGFWGQGVSESLMGTQLSLNKVLDTIFRSIELFGVPRVFVEEGSKVNKAAFQNKIGVIIPFRGTPPIFSVSQSNSQEMYEERARIIQFGFEQEGLSMLSATSQKPSGLNSGEAQRVYQDINSDRFASLERRYTNFYVDLAYQIIDKAIDIATREGHYSTIFTDRRKGTKEIELPDIKLLQDPFVIQAYVQSSLPKDPAGRLQKITEMIQSNMVTIQEGRRLLDFPDLGQIETLANASEERIFAYMDDIIEDGKYQGPDQWMNLEKATEIVTQYINLYSVCKVEEEKIQMLRDFFAEIQDLKMAMMPPPPPEMPMPQDNQLAAPMPLPQSPLLPQGGGAPQMMAEGGEVKAEPGEQSYMDQARGFLQENPIGKALHYGAEAFKFASPTAWAFSEAGNPETKGDLLSSVAHVPAVGANLAATIPPGWKSIAGESIDRSPSIGRLKNVPTVEEIARKRHEDVLTSITGGDDFLRRKTFNAASQDAGKTYKEIAKELINEEKQYSMRYESPEDSDFVKNRLKELDEMLPFVEEKVKTSLDSSKISWEKMQEEDRAYKAYLQKEKERLANIPVSMQVGEKPMSPQKIGKLNAKERKALEAEEAQKASDFLTNPKRE